MSAEDRVDTKEELLCASCQRWTEHTILVSYNKSWSNDEEGMAGSVRHEFLRCNGCKSGTYRENSWSTEDPDGSETLHPPRGQEIRPAKHFLEVPWSSPLRKVYRQTITAYNADLLTLAGAGVRLLIEGICKDKGVDEGPIFDKQTGQPIISKKTKQPVIKDNLEGKINAMVDKGFILKSQALHLHEIRFLGNETAHDLHIPDKQDVTLAIDIVEHIFEQVYEQPAKAKALASRRKPGDSAIKWPKVAPKPPPSPTSATPALPPPPASGTAT